jgi:hypothetical protein
MSTARRDEWEDRGDAMGSEPEAPNAWSRRALLGAASGFGLATSGLLLPEWLVAEAEAADDHPARPIQDRAGQKRSKRRHRREHHREVHRRQDDNDANQRQDENDANQDKPRGGVFDDDRAVAIFVHNYRRVPVQVQGWQPNPGPLPYHVPPGWNWSTIPARAADGSHSAKEFIGTAHQHVIVRIDTRWLVNAWNDPTYPLAHRSRTASSTVLALTRRWTPWPIKNTYRLMTGLWRSWTTGSRARSGSRASTTRPITCGSRSTCGKPAALLSRRGRRSSGHGQVAATWPPPAKTR